MKNDKDSVNDNNNDYYSEIIPSLYGNNKINRNFPIKTIQKTENSSNIIATMQSLSQIRPFAYYFLDSNIIKEIISKKNDNKTIIQQFKIYMEKLWTSEELFNTKEFMKTLKKISKDEFSLKEELEPSIFYNYILDELNKELNGCDKKISEYFQNMQNNLKRFDKNDKLKEFYQQFIKENNSIVSYIFYGIIKISSFCNFCSQDLEEEYKKFNLIDINIENYCNSKHMEGNSLTNIYLDELIKSHFDDIKDGQINCKNCKKKKDKYIRKKIIELPDFLTIKMNWGNFDHEKGFLFEKDFYKPSYKFLIVEEIIEINKENIDEKFGYNKNKKINDTIKYKLFSTIDFFKDNNKNRFLNKCRIIEEGKEDKWYISWGNASGKIKKNYEDDFSIPCLLFYKKI